MPERHIITGFEIEIAFEVSIGLWLGVLGQHFYGLRDPLTMNLQTPHIDWSWGAPGTKAMIWGIWWGHSLSILGDL